MVHLRPVDHLGLLLAAGLVVLDQLTKWVVVQGMRLHESVPVVPGLLNLTYVRNTGAAFGILSSPSPGLRSTLLLAFSMVAMGFVLWIWFREKPSSRLQVASLGMILGGALGNLVDRVRLGEVIDFLDLYWGPHHWPAFNVADSAITVGVLLFLMGLLRATRSRSGS